IADAKAEIFDGMDGAGIAILNRDNIYFATLAARAWGRGLDRVIGFGAHPDADVRLLAFEPAGEGSAMSASVARRAVRYTLPVAGRHWAINSLAILGAVDALGGDVEQAAAA